MIRSNRRRDSSTVAGLCAKLGCKPDANIGRAEEAQGSSRPSHLPVIGVGAADATIDREEWEECIEWHKWLQSPDVDSRYLPAYPDD